MSIAVEVLCEGACEVKSFTEYVAGDVELDQIAAQNILNIAPKRPP